MRRFLLAAAVASCGARTPLGELIVPDAGCVPVACPSEHHWDAASCACVRDRCPDDAGEITIATIATDFAQGTAITVHDGDVYWTTRAGKGDSEGVVSKVSRCGGTVTTLASGLYGPSALAVDGVRVFFGTIGGTVKGALQMVPASGGSVTTIATGAIYSGAITTDASNVYWTSESTMFGVYTAPSNGGTPTPIGPDQIFNFIAVDATRVFLSQPASIPANSKMLSMPLSGGALSVLVSSDVVFPGVMVIDDASVYCVVGASNLTRVPKSGGATTTLAHAEINGLAVDATNVYWAQGDATTGTPGAIKRVPKAGGAVVELSKTNGTAIAIDETYVYWLNGGKVYRLPK